MRDERSAPSLVQVRLVQQIEWDAKRIVILRPKDTSLVMQDILMFVFGHELERFLYLLLGAGGSEDTIVQQLVCTSTDN